MKKFIRGRQVFCFLHDHLINTFNYIDNSDWATCLLCTPLVYLSLFIEGRRVTVENDASA